MLQDLLSCACQLKRYHRKEEQRPTQNGEANQNDHKISTCVDLIYVCVREVVLDLISEGGELEDCGQHQEAREHERRTDCQQVVRGG